VGILVSPDLSNIMKRFCVACGACVGACPTDSIQPIVDHGVASIEMDLERCSNCNLCAEVCPVFDYFRTSEAKKLSKGTYLQLFTGNSCDEQIKNHAASGGLVTALSSYLLETGEIDGVLTLKMDGTEPFPFIAESPSELKDARGSIYFTTFNLKVVNLLKESSRKVAIVGLPCQINAVRKLIRQGVLGKDTVKYLFGLRCYHINSPWYLDYVLSCMLPIAKSRVIQITSRRHGWKGGINVKCEVGTYFVPLVFDWKSGIGLFNPMSLERFNAQRGCVVCKDRDSFNADITFAEAWFTVGKSLIVTRTKRGFDLVNRVLLEGKIAVAPVQEAHLPHLIEGEDSAYECQQQIANDVLERGLLFSCKKHGAATMPVAMPHMIFSSPFMRKLLLPSIPPKTLMSAIGFYSKFLNKYFCGKPRAVFED
jgi:coenzyme F420 hydrogenase subunit beta